MNGLKVGIVKQEEVTDARQRCSKDVSVATDSDATIEEAVFSMGFKDRQHPSQWVSADTLMRNYSATNVVPTQKDKSLLSSERRPHF
jgi:hypothetical protein